MRLLRVIWAAYRAYKLAGESGTAYTAVTYLGVPQVACFIATGREAWRVTHKAILEKL